MKVRPEQLAKTLSQGISGVYLVSGDEHLLAIEACDLIRAAAKKQGYKERQVFQGNQLNWNDFIAETQALSLFADKRVIELQLGNAKIGDKGSKAIQEYLGNISPDICLLVITDKLDRSQARSKWVKALENYGAHVQIWPVDHKQLPGWLNQRLQAKGLNATPDALQLLSERVEGNLLAAQQEIEKLSLLPELAQGGTINLETMNNAVTSSARYDLFGLADRALNGNITEARRHLQGLREEGTEATLVLWSLSREIRILARVQETANKGGNIDAAMRDAGVWDKRKPMVLRSVKKIPTGLMRIMIRQIRLADDAIKGRNSENPWAILLDMLHNMSGQPVLNKHSFTAQLSH